MAAIACRPSAPMSKRRKLRDNEEQTVAEGLSPFDAPLGNSVVSLHPGGESLIMVWSLMQPSLNPATRKFGNGNTGHQGCVRPSS